MEQLLRIVRLAIWNEHDATPPIIDDWQSFIRLAKEQAVLGIVTEGVALLPRELQPDASGSLSLMRYLVANERKYTSQRSSLKKLLETYSNLGVHPVVMKGLSIASRYDTPAHRAVGDVDLYFHDPKEVEITNTWVAEQGDVEYKPTEKHMEYLWNGLIVESHWLLMVLSNPKYNRIIKQMVALEMQQPLPQRDLGEGCVITELPVNLYAIFLLLHASHHLVEEGLGLRHVLDWMMFLKCHHQELDGAKIEQWLHALGLVPMARAFASICTRDLGLPESYLPCPLPYDDKLRSLLLREMQQGGNFGRNYYTYKGKVSKLKDMWLTFKTRWPRYMEVYPLWPGEVRWCIVDAFRKGWFMMFR